MTEPNADGKDYQFDHPEKMFTADDAIARAAEIVKACADNDGDGIEALIATALIDVWHKGATFGSEEATAMAARVINKAVTRSIAEYLEQKAAPGDR